MLDVAEGNLAVVVGAGTLGIIGMWALQAAGARVAVVQRSEARRHLAAELGADAVLDPETTSPRRSEPSPLLRS
jgi:NADPH2:quinone reductase